MEPPSRTRRAGAVFIALPMLFFGSLMFLFGYIGLREWRAEGTALIACSVAWIVAGPAVAGCALWLLGSLGRSPLALRIAAAGLVASGTVLAASAATGVLPCGSPG